MTYDEIIEIFEDDTNPAGAVLKLSVMYPNFSGKDLISVFKTICENYHVFKTDSVIHRNNTLTIESYSDRILRTLYQIMFETNYWDTEILFQPSFVNAFTVFYNNFKFKNITLPKKPGGSYYVSNTTYELFDKLDEFRYRLTDKIQTHCGK